MTHRAAKALRLMLWETLDHPRVIWTAAVGLGLFLLITVLVQLRLLAGFDLAIAVSIQSLVGNGMDLWSAATSIAFSAEMSLLYATVAFVILRRSGAGPWAFAPFAFLPILAIEVAMKLQIDQPGVDREFLRPAFYPFLSVSLNGSFPSGHAIRSAFLCTFAGVFLWQSARPAARLAALLLIPLVVMLGIGRIYMGYHWASDVVAGALLGASVALVVAVPAAERIRKRRVKLRAAEKQRAGVVAGPQDMQNQ